MYSYVGFVILVCSGTHAYSVYSRVYKYNLTNRIGFY